MPAGPAPEAAGPDVRADDCADSEPDDVDEDSDEDCDEESEDEPEDPDPALDDSAHATPCPAVMAAPIPKAKASGPTRPMNLT